MRSDVVVLVHGLWMSGLELRVLQRRLREEYGFDVHVFAYPTLRGKLADISHALAEFASRVGGEDRVHFVGHSLGGALVYQTLCEQAGRFRGNVVLLGSPLGGSKAARQVSRFKVLRPLLGPHVLEELVEPHERAWKGANAIGAIAGRRPLGTGRLFAHFDEDNDGTVAVSETVIPGLGDHLVLDHSHMGMLFAADVAGQVAEFLRHGHFQTPAGQIPEAVEKFADRGATNENVALRYVRRPLAGPLSAGVLEPCAIPMPQPQEGEILVRTLLLAVDGGCRAQFDDRSAGGAKARLDEVPASPGLIGAVIESRHPGWKPGDLVASTHARWQHYETFRPADERCLRKLDPTAGPLSLHLGALGAVGLAAYVGMLEMGRPRPGETVLVSAAASATGSLAGQFARIAGARVVGIACGAESCAVLQDELGFHVCMDERQGDVRAQVQAACAGGVDVCFENAGGEVRRIVLDNMNIHGRMIVSEPDGLRGDDGRPLSDDLDCVLLKRLTIRGFTVTDHLDRMQEFIAQASDWHRQARLRHRPTITLGLENIHAAINAVTEGRNAGPHVCQVSDAPPGCTI